MLRLTTVTVLTVSTLLLATGCGDDEPEAEQGATETATTGGSSPSASPDSAAYAEILGSIVELDEHDADDSAPIIDAGSANLALDWSEASSPYMFAEYFYDDANEIGRWCITSKQGAYLTMTTDGDDTLFMVGDGQHCEYDQTAAKIVAEPREVSYADSLAGQIEIVSGSDLIDDGFAAESAAINAASEINIHVDEETETGPATFPADEAAALPAGFEIRDYETPGQGSWYSFCVVDTATGAWATVTETVVGSGPSGAACTYGA